MSTGTVTLRPLRTDARAAKRKTKTFSKPTIPDNGEPVVVTKPASPKSRKPIPMPDYWARVIARQPIAMSAEETKRFWEEERGDR